MDRQTDKHIIAYAVLNYVAQPNISSYFQHIFVKIVVYYRKINFCASTAHHCKQLAKTFFFQQSTEISRTSLTESSFINNGSEKPWYWKITQIL